jgi:hypothetical protein
MDDPGTYAKRRYSGGARRTDGVLEDRGKVYRLGLCGYVNGKPQRCPRSVLSHIDFSIGVGLLDKWSKEERQQGVSLIVVWKEPAAYRIFEESSGHQIDDLVDIDLVRPNNIYLRLHCENSFQ